MIKVHQMSVELEFITPVLGTKPSDMEVYNSFIENKAKGLFLIEKGYCPKSKLSPTLIQQAEAEGYFEKNGWKSPTGHVADEDKGAGKGVTVFLRNKDGKPILEGYMLKGQFKAAGPCLSSVKGTAFYGLSKQMIITKLTEKVFVKNDIVLNCENLDWCSRPLLSDHQGEKVSSLSRSEMAPAGTKTDPVKIVWLEESKDPEDKKNTKICDIQKMVIDGLNYGVLKGLGQWRNSNKGSFKYKILNKDEIFEIEEDKLAEFLTEE